MDIIFLVIGLLVGFFAGWLFKKSQGSQTTENTDLISGLQQQVLTESNIKSSLQSENNIVKQELMGLRMDYKEAQERLVVLSNQLTAEKSESHNLLKRLEEHKAEITTLNERFTKEFENLANRIFDDKSQKFTEQNKNNLGELLNPLGEKIKDFEKKVNEVYISEGKERASLKNQLEMLQQLNQQMSKEANNLTKALKGENKTQGNWGEFILENILEKSGLVKGSEYKVQESYTNEEGRRLQPDVIISLPDNKTLIIDSKVSLTAYEKFYSAEEDEVRIVAVREHLLSLRAHIKSLGDKSYQNIHQIKTLDFVLLFIPIEPAFALAVQNDAGLFNDAFEKNIVIVSPSTLLATLRTVSSIWRYERQSANALDIAQKAGDLYDKFEGFVKDMIEVGKKIDQSKAGYADAMNKLVDGKGNIISRFETLKQLGAKASKQLPQQLIDRAEQ
ncbi:MAG: DNA recombination protein RmuC [Bacteroidota bacterium]